MKMFTCLLVIFLLLGGWAGCTRRLEKWEIETENKTEVDLKIKFDNGDNIKLQQSVIWWLVGSYEQNKSGFEYKTNIGDDIRNQWYIWWRAGEQLWQRKIVRIEKDGDNLVWPGRGKLYDNDDLDLVCFLGMLMLAGREDGEPNTDERNLGTRCQI